MSKETKRERFVRVAETRVNKLLEMIRLLGNCSSKTNYEYNDEDVSKIFSVLEKEMKNARSKFMGTDPKSERFTLQP